jgi:pimeloyl-ACP methyl ester carboxylesterase
MAASTRASREARSVRCNIERLARKWHPRPGDHRPKRKPARRFDDCRTVRRRPPKAQVKLVDDANHLVFVDQTELVLTRLRNFLTEPEP